MDYPPRLTKEVGTPPVRELPTPTEIMSKDISGIKARLDKLESYLSFFEKYRPIIDKVVATCQIIKGFFKTSWKAITAIGTVLGIWAIGHQYHWWQLTKHRLFQH
jgi:hypothetical protein